MLKRINNDYVYLGQDDDRLALFENVYPIPRGVSYNSYLLLDEKNVLLDTVDWSQGEAFLNDLRSGLNGQSLDYVIVNHMEPDHAGTLAMLLSCYPQAQAVMTKKAQQMFGQFFELDIADRCVTVAENSTLSTGRHTFRFLTAPMVHWPEVMVTFDETDGILFSADAFGTFGSLHGKMYADQVAFEHDWLDDARRYYANIVGKYGTPVQTLLKKASALPIKMIAPLHGPIWRENISWFVGKYDLWSRYEPEDATAVIFSGSVYGHTHHAAAQLATALTDRGLNDVRIYDVSKTDLSILVSEAFRCKTIIFAASTYNNGIFTPMETLLNDLQAHDLQNRVYAIIENGSWAPNSGKLMLEKLSALKRMTRVGDTLTLRSAFKPDQQAQLSALADAVASATK